MKNKNGFKRMLAVVLAFVLAVGMVQPEFVRRFS